MSLVRNTASAVLAYALSLQGRSRKLGNTTWTNSSTIDDCARFCSHVLWGGMPGPISWVDTFKTAGDGAYHRGKAGLQPGDVVLFDWEANGVGNHVEFCLTAPSSTGAFTTIGANGSDTVAAKVRTRNGYVLGYFRPAWGSTSPTPAQPDPIQEESTMTAQLYRSASGTIALIDPLGTTYQACTNIDQANRMIALGLSALPKWLPLSDADFAYFQSLVVSNRAGIAGAVWGTPLDGPAGPVQAGGRLVDINSKAGSGGSATVDERTVATIADGVLARLAALFTTKK